MWMPDRRQLLLSASFGLGAFAVPGLGLAQLLRQSGFTHNVASGEPSQQSVLLWTRYRPTDGGSATLRAEVSETADFARVVSGAEAEVSGARDYVAKPVVTGLAPGRWYFFRFIAADGTTSPVGRTRTLPEGTVQRYAIGVFSCANLPFGWFNAYGHAAQRQDIDLIVHTGDYFYEYQRGQYPGVEQAIRERVIEPAGETIALADYRLRFASYRSDPDLQRLHQLFPMVAMPDDHESANDSWRDGAQNHQPEEGDWTMRKAASVQAYREWMPVSDDYWASYAIGDLATLFRLETRLTGRTRQLDLAAALVGPGDLGAKLLAFRDGPLADPAGTMMSGEEEQWLFEGLGSSVRRGARWQVVAQQTNIGKQVTPTNTADFLAADAPDYVKQRVMVGIAAAKAGIAGNLDNWGGYPAARARLLKAAQSADADLIVLSGDSHNAWLFNLAQDGRPAGVEFGGHSVSSPGYESYFTGATPTDVAKALVAASDELTWADTSRRGYMVTTLTPERADNEWVFMDTVRARSLATQPSFRAGVVRGARTVAA